MRLTARISMLILFSIFLNSAAYFGLTHYQQKSLYKQSERILVDTLVHALRDAIVRDVINNNKLRVGNLLRKLKVNENPIEYVVVTDGNGLFAHSFQHGFPRYLLDIVGRQIGEPGIKLSGKYQTDQGLIYEYSELLFPGLDAAIHIGINQSRIQYRLAENKMEMFGLSVAITLFVLLPAFYLGRKITKPLSDFSRLIARYGRGDEVSIGDFRGYIPEIRELAGAFQSAIAERLLALSELKAREEDLAVTLNSIGDAVITCDAKGTVTRMNPIAENLTGWKLQEGMGKPLLTIFPIVDARTRLPIENPVDRVLTDGEIIYLSNHTTLISRDGSEYQIADSAAPILGNDRIITGAILVFNDVTEQYRLRERAKSLQQQLQALLDDMKTWVAILDPDGSVGFVNNTPLDAVGLEDRDVLGKKFWENKAFEHDSELRASVRNDVAKAASGVNVLRDIQVSTKRGLLWVEFSLHPVFGENGIIIQVVAEGRDISERKDAEAKMLRQAYYDSLTGLPNRFLSLDRLTQNINEAKRSRELVAVLFLDLDNFKKINDSLGHETGDKLLVEASKRLRKILREGDTVGRLGGDEFIILLPGIHHAIDVQVVAENLLACFRDLFSIEGRELALTVSIGIAIYPGDGATLSELLRNSDSAMYHAKENGRNTYSYFTETMNRDAERRIAIEEQMHGALDRGEFEVYYQPQIEVSSEKIVAVEALLRWHNPILGELSPDEFVPISEQSGFIVNLGRFVIRQALARLSMWREDCGAKLRMAVNLSPRQFRDPNLASKLEDALKRNGIAGELLELEITEGLLMSGHDYIEETLSAIANLGISIAMDDFGTGYSSLSYLRRYSFDALKIDKSFIQDITFEESDNKLIAGAIAMAHGMGLTVVAEGVETREQFLCLRKLGCDYAQGYLFGRPMPAGEIANLLGVTKAEHN